MGRLARLGQVSVPFLSDVERGRRHASARVVTLYEAMVLMAEAELQRATLPNQKPTKEVSAHGV